MHFRAEYKKPEQLADGAVLVVGTGQSGTPDCGRACRIWAPRFACVGSRSLRIPRRVRGKDITWWLHKTGLYDKKFDDLSIDVQMDKRFGPNPSQCPGRDVRFRELCKEYDFTLLGKLCGVKEGTSSSLRARSSPLIC